jgi:fluoride exporter
LGADDSYRISDIIIMRLYLLIALGGALGTVARYFLGTHVAVGDAFPWSTLLINVSGSFAIGLAATLVAEGRWFASTEGRLFFMTGICGGFTTFSAFSLQTLSLFQDGAWARGGAYVLASVVLCLIAVWAGYALAVAINEAGK